MSRIHNIFEILDHYDILLFDIWGVITEQEVYDGVVDAINEISKLKNIFIVTNMACSRLMVKQRFIDINLLIDEHKIFTAGETAKNLIESGSVFNTNPKIFCFSLEDCQHLFENSKAARVNSIEEADLVMFSQYVDDISEVNKFNRDLEKALQLGLIGLCPNPDTIVVNGDRVRYCPGFFAEKYQKMGGKVHFTGKPYKEIYEEVFSQLDLIDKSRVLMIGDTLETDIQGAKNVGIDSALVTTGNMSRFLNENTVQDDHKYESLIKKAKSLDIVPNWIIEIKNL